MNTNGYLMIGALSASVLAGTLAYASQRDDRDAAARALAAQPAISLSQAIAIAEQHAQGSATSAELERKDGKAYYEVDVAAAGGTVEVKLDVRDGSVIGTKSKHADKDEHGEYRR